MAIFSKESIKTKTVVKWWTAPERLYLTGDKSRVVKEGDLDARYLFIREGGEVDIDEAIRYGLAPAEASPEAEVAPVEAKAVSEAPQTKQVKLKETK